MLSNLSDTPVQSVLTTDYDRCHSVASVQTKASAALPGRWQIHEHMNIMHVNHDHEDYSFIYWKCIRDNALRMMQKSIGKFGLLCLS